MSGPIRVLHVDDESGFADLTQTCLEDEDPRITVETATSVGDALDELPDGVDCIVSGHDMPGTNGVEFLETVRDSHPDLPFILFTGKGSEEVASDAISAGVTDYLQKESSTDQFTVLADRIGNAVEKHAAEQAVAATRRRFEKLLTHSADYIHILDADGRIEYSTPSVERVLGYESGEHTGEVLFERIHPADREQFLEEFERLTSGALDEITAEIRVRHADGSWRWLELRERDLLGDPDIDGIVGNVRDVTERKESEARIDWQRAVLRNMEEGVYVLDGDAVLQFVNYRASDLESISEDDWIGRPLSYLADIDILSASEVEWIEDGVDRLLTEEVDEVRIEIEPSLPESTEVVELRLTPLSLDGEDDLILGTTRDITERKEREEQLQRTKGQYQALAENFPDGGVFLFDDDCTYTLADGAELAAVGIEPGDLVGARPDDLFPEPIAEELTDYYERALAGEEHTFEQQYEGEKYLIQTLPIRGDDGEVVAGMAVSRNVTERTERQERLERQNERLGEFASVVSHDLRNPLQVAIARVEMAQNDPESGHLGEALHALDRMEGIIGDLLTLARHGDRVDEVETVDLEQTVADCWRTVSTADATLTVEAQQDILADRSQLQHLLENLLTNAVEHGGEDVSITVGDLDEGFYVEDDGPGIPADERDAVFEAGHSSAEDGTGFGLSIVREVAASHGWDVGVTASDDGGARFEIVGVEQPSPAV